MLCIKLQFVTNISLNIRVNIPPNQMKLYTIHRFQTKYKCNRDISLRLYFCRQISARLINTELNLKVNIYCKTFYNLLNTIKLKEFCCPILLHLFMQPVWQFTSKGLIHLTLKDMSVSLHHLCVSFLTSFFIDRLLQRWHTICNLIGQLWIINN